MAYLPNKLELLSLSIVINNTPLYSKPAKGTLLLIFSSWNAQPLKMKTF